MPAPSSAASRAPMACDGNEVELGTVEGREGPELGEVLSLSNVPSMMVSNTFLDKNSQSHTSAMTAFGDIIDNCKESGASKLSIDVRTYSGRPMLIISDNGTGMTEAKVREGLMSIGYTSKDLSTGKHYGFGAKTAIPRICDSAFLFTREAESRYRTVGLISTVFSDKMGSTETKMPLCSWEEHGSGVVTGTSEHYAPLTFGQREASGEQTAALQQIPVQLSPCAPCQRASR